MERYGRQPIHHRNKHQFNGSMHVTQAAKLSGDRIGCPQLHPRHLQDINRFHFIQRFRTHPNMELSTKKGEKTRDATSNHISSSDH
jgi:hypothetical protein